MASNKSSYSSARRQAGTSARPRYVMGLLAGLLVVVPAIIFLLPSERTSSLDEAEPAETPKAAQDERQAAVATEITSAAEVTAVQKESVKASEPAKASETAADEKKPGVFAPGMLRLPNGFELRFKLPAEGETRQLMAGGEIWEVDSKGEIRNITPPPVFEKPFEGMISSLIERDGMVLPFALKQYSEEEVRRMCSEPTLSYDDDTPEITAKRENVAMIKSGILDYLEGGGKFEDFVDEMIQHSQDAQRARIQGYHEIRELLMNGRGRDALQYYRAVSQELTENGYGELKLPPSFRKALEEEMNK